MSRGDCVADRVCPSPRHRSWCSRLPLLVPSSTTAFLHGPEYSHVSHETGKTVLHALIRWVFVTRLRQGTIPRASFWPFYWLKHGRINNKGKNMNIRKVATITAAMVLTLASVKADNVFYERFQYDRSGDRFTA